jgi:hypothetical protein
MHENRQMKRILDEGIKPNALAVARIFEERGTAVVVFEPMGMAVQAARDLGWDGKSPIFKLRAGAARRLASSDSATRAWLERRTSGRILVIAHEGTMLVNYTPGVGYSVEPGSTDAECVSWCQVWGEATRVAGAASPARRVRSPRPHGGLYR